MDSDNPDQATEFFGQFLDDYYAECDEHLISIRRLLVPFEDSADGRAIDRSLLDELFRSFHTIKGISGMVGLTPAERLAHNLESYLRELREGTTTLSESGFAAVVGSVSLLESVIDAHRNEQPIPSIDGLVSQLVAVSKTASEGSESSSGSALMAAENSKSQSEARRWQAEFTPTPQLAERGINLNNVRARLQEVGELIEAKPIVKSAGEIAFQFVIATNADRTVLEKFAEDGVIFQALRLDHLPQSQERRSRTIAPANIVRVDLERLDELVRIIGELVISRTRLSDQLKELQRVVPAAVWRTLQETNQCMGRQLRDLRDSVMRVRMVQIGEVFERMTFVVRDLARESGKKITVQMSGGETEIDKFLVERMMDPLMHLVRNSASHGLETPLERESAGKSSEGLLTLSATTAGETIIIKIADDGRGIDRQLVVARAQASGLIHGGSEVDDATLLDLICSPGLSTRDGADRESGRGVGMDVVRKALDELGGGIWLTTKTGVGTAFTIELPLTLAIAEALIVNVSGQRFAVPQSAVREVMEVEPHSVKALENNEIISYRGKALPVVRLAHLFEMDYRRDANFHMLVIGDDANPVGLAVDRIVGQSEIVVRPINDPLAQVNGIDGATELGDQKVVLILDIGALREFAENGRH